MNRFKLNSYCKHIHWNCLSHFVLRAGSKFWHFWYWLANTVRLRFPGSESSEKGQKMQVFTANKVFQSNAIRLHATSNGWRILLSDKKNLSQTSFSQQSINSFELKGKLHFIFYLYIPGSTFIVIGATACLVLCSVGSVLEFQWKMLSLEAAVHSHWSRYAPDIGARYPIQYFNH